MGSTRFALLAACSTSRLTKPESLASRESSSTNTAHGLTPTTSVVAPRRVIARRDPAGYAVASSALQTRGPGISPKYG